MNLYFRILRILLKAWFSPRIQATATSQLTFRIWPFDCDINLHLTNARYFSFMDLGRLYYVGQIKLIGKLLKRKWLPVVGSSEKIVALTGDTLTAPPTPESIKLFRELIQTKRSIHG